MMRIFILHGVVILGFIILVLSRLPIIHIVVVIIVLILIILSILVDLLLSSLLKCFGLLSLKPTEHAYDLLNYLEHVVDHGGRQLSLGVECGGEPDDEGLPLVDVREPLAHLVLEQLAKELVHQVALAEESESRVRVVSEGG
jgi:hypothetical protein